jgi:hypothetical protein
MVSECGIKGLYFDIATRSDRIQCHPAAVVILVGVTHVPLGALLEKIHLVVGIQRHPRKFCVAADVRMEQGAPVIVPR